jgi:hypothetical protein
MVSSPEAATAVLLCEAWMPILPAAFGSNVMRLMPNPTFLSVAWDSTIGGAGESALTACAANCEPTVISATATTAALTCHIANALPLLL